MLTVFLKFSYNDEYRVKRAPTPFVYLDIIMPQRKEWKATNTTLWAQ